MVRKRNRDILFHIENEVQFESLKPLLVYLRDKTDKTFDIVVPDDTTEATIHNKKVHDGGAKILKDNGFTVVRSIDGEILPKSILATNYKIFLSAYIYKWHRQNVAAKYFIMFPYASYYFNKPQWTIEMFIQRDFMADALISHAIGTKPVTDIFTRTHVVPSLKLMDYKKSSKKKEKPVLFFAPTYNEIDFAVQFLQHIDEIKEKYTVAMRGHHRVVNVDENKDISQQLYDAADVIYDMEEYSLPDSLGEVDVVVSDNSAVIFDAVYCGVPVALFSKDLESLQYKDIHTIQAKLVASGDILWTDNSQNICQMVDQTLTKKIVERQKKVQNELFPDRTDTDPVSRWMDILTMYLDDELPEEYSLTKGYWLEKRFSLEEDSTKLRQELAAREGCIHTLNEQIEQKNRNIISEQNPGIITASKRLVKAIIRKIYTKPKQKLKYVLRLQYRKMKIKYFDAPIVIYQFIFTVPTPSMNFGDELTKDIVERIFHKKTEIHNHIDARFDMLGVGSLLHFFNDIVDYKIYVWGSGLIDDATKNINKNFKFKAVRGKVTRAMLPEKYRHVPVGDPGLLCNLMYTDEVEKTNKIGVIPHFRDEYSYFLNDVIKKHPDMFKIIPVGQPPEKVANEIKSCKLILSSSLHGLIVADSFGVPNIHLVLSDNLLSPNHLRGGEYKFRDYYSGVGRKYENFNPRDENLLDAEKYDQIIKAYKPIEDLEAIQKRLIKAFPYR